MSREHGRTFQCGEVFFVTGGRPMSFYYLPRMRAGNVVSLPAEKARREALFGRLLTVAVVLAVVGAALIAVLLDVS